MFFYQAPNQMPVNGFQWNFVPFVSQDGTSSSPVFFVNNPNAMWGIPQEFKQQENCIQAPKKEEHQIEESCLEKTKLTSQKKFPKSNLPKVPTKKKTGTSKGKGEQQFKPYLFEAKKKRKAFQDSNRNVSPNIVHQILSFLQKQSKSKKLVQKLMTKIQKELGTAKSFYLYQSMIKDKMHHYVNIQVLEVFKKLQQPQCELFSEEQQEKYLKVSRILIEHFLRNEFPSIILHSKRMDSNKKLDHLHYRRKILEQLQSIFYL